MEVIKKRRHKSRRERAFTESGGGLALRVEVGEQLIIEYGTESLVVTFCGKAGDGVFKLGFLGPKSFKVSRQGNLFESENKHGIRAVQKTS